MFPWHSQWAISLKSALVPTLALQNSLEKKWQSNDCTWDHCNNFDVGASDFYSSPWRHLIALAGRYISGKWFRKVNTTFSLTFLYNCREVCPGDKPKKQFSIEKKYLGGQVPGFSLLALQEQMIFEEFSELCSTLYEILFLSCQARITFFRQQNDLLDHIISW